MLPKSKPAAQSLTAWHDLLVQVALLVAACMLAGGMMFFVSRHVTWPAGRDPCSAMLKLAGGDFEVVLHLVSSARTRSARWPTPSSASRSLAVDKAAQRSRIEAMKRQQAEAERQAQVARVEAEAQAKVAAERAEAVRRAGAHAFAHAWRGAWLASPTAISTIRPR